MPTTFWGGKPGGVEEEKGPQGPGPRGGEAHLEADAEGRRGEKPRPFPPSSDPLQAPPKPKPRREDHGEAHEKEDEVLRPLELREEEASQKHPRDSAQKEPEKRPGVHLPLEEVDPSRGDLHQEAEEEGRAHGHLRGKPQGEDEEGRRNRPRPHPRDPDGEGDEKAQKKGHLPLLAVQVDAALQLALSRPAARAGVRGV
ncbi:hypothetical protein TTMY_0698 [Thermus thermophilus]|nr:hypothetical protein TTMY_0698 [Thermus thermophilus]BDB11778.1 hypothetical protein TthTMY_15170 [Thermus thermophilus]